MNIKLERKRREMNKKNKLLVRIFAGIMAFLMILGATSTLLYMILGN